MPAHGQVQDAPLDRGGPQVGAPCGVSQHTGVPYSDSTTRVVLLGAPAEASGPDGQALVQLSLGDAIITGCFKDSRVAQWKHTGQPSFADLGNGDHDLSVLLDVRVILGC